jgi:hypothetical protein
MTKGATMLRRASQYAVTSGNKPLIIRWKTGSGKTHLVNSDLYLEALEKAGKKLWAAKAKVSASKKKAKK